MPDKRATGAPSSAPSGNCEFAPIRDGATGRPNHTIVTENLKLKDENERLLHEREHFREEQARLREERARLVKDVDQARIDAAAIGEMADAAEAEVERLRRLVLQAADRFEALGVQTYPENLRRWARAR